MRKLFIVLILLGTACRVQPSDDGSTEVIVRNKMGIDGCGYLLETKSGVLLNPQGLADSLAREGLRLAIWYKEDPGRIDICMMGTPVRILTALKRN